MIWLIPDGEYLVEGERCRLPGWAGFVRCPGGDPVRPARFYLVTPGGAVRRTFSEPIEYSIDDEIGLASIHAVSSDALRSYHFRQHRWNEPEVGSEVELAGLRTVGPGESRSTPVVSSRRTNNTSKRAGNGTEKKTSGHGGSCRRS